MGSRQHVRLGFPVREVEEQIAVPLGVHHLRRKVAPLPLGNAEHDTLQVVFVPVEPNLRVIPGMVEVVADVVPVRRFLYGVVHHRAQVALCEVFPVVQATPVAVVVDLGDEVAPSACGEQYIHRLIDLRGIVDGNLLIVEDTILDCRSIGQLASRPGDILAPAAPIQQPPGDYADDSRQQQNPDALENPPDPFFHMLPSRPCSTSIITYLFTGEKQNFTLDLTRIPPPCYDGEQRRNPHVCTDYRFCAL